MTSYVVRRLLSVLPLMLGISLMTFALMHLAPGGPTTVMLDPTMRTEDLERITRIYGLDQSWPTQYTHWLRRVVTGNWGRSFVDGRQVTEKILERLPNTLWLMGLSLLVALLVAVPLGIISAVRQYSITDHMATIVALVGVSLPSFWYGLLLIMVFSLHFNWFPSHGMGTYGVANWIDRLRYLVLPVGVLGLGTLLATFTRHIRASMLDVIGNDYVRTARAKGLGERRVIYGHALRNALMPVVTVFGLTIPALFGGALIVENLFAIPGMGRLALQSALSRDYNTLMAINLVAAGLMVGANVITDILYVLIDPRIRFD